MKIFLNNPKMDSAREIINFSRVFFKLMSVIPWKAIEDFKAIMKCYKSYARSVALYKWPCNFPLLIPD